jgi:hypothetical protein
LPLEGGLVRIDRLGGCAALQEGARGGFRVGLALVGFLEDRLGLGFRIGTAGDPFLRQQLSGPLLDPAAVRPRRSPRGKVLTREKRKRQSWKIDTRGRPR